MYSGVVDDSKVVDDSNFFRAEDLAANGSPAISESGHYNRSVRRNNFLTLWLNEYEADAFIATHLYGAV